MLHRTERLASPFNRVLTAAAVVVAERSDHPNRRHVAGTMTAARQQRKQACSALVLAVFVGFCRLPGPAAGGTDEQIVVDPHTGLAISGFDPVAYFTDGKPRSARPDFELTVRRRGLALPQCRQPGGLRRPSRGLYAPVSAATIRWRSRAASRCPAIRRSGSGERAALSVLRRARREPPSPPTRPLHRVRPTRKWPAVAAHAWSLALGWRAGAGSPQAMKPGTRNSWGSAVAPAARPAASATLPPAAARMAWPAATSHSQVGASRG